LPHAIIRALSSGIDLAFSVGMAKTYDERQTELCNQVRVFLQSVAIQAVQAQELDPSCDGLQDMLGSIESDLERLREMTGKLNRDDV
jgi:hypothetical protein